jgi:hypothetical protein
VHAVTSSDVDLNSIGIQEGTDKSFLGNDYLRHYDRILGPYRELPVNVLEIGVQTGASLRSWRRYFSSARLMGIDIEPTCQRLSGPDFEVRIGSQIDAAFLAQIAVEHAPTIVIDDGSHVSDHQIFSFEQLFPAVLPGGCYIIEDMFFQALPRTAADFRGVGPVSAIDYVAGIAAGLMGQHLDPATSAAHRQLRLMIDRVEVFPRAAAIFKRPNTEPAEQQIQKARSALAASAGSSTSWFNFYRFLIAHRRPIAEIEYAAAQERDMSGNTLAYHLRMADAHEQQQSTAGAIAELRAAIAITANKEQLAALQARHDALASRPSQ